MGAVRDPKTGKFPKRDGAPVSKGASRDQIQNALDAAAESLSRADGSKPGTREAQTDWSRVTRLAAARAVTDPAQAAYVPALIGKGIVIDGAIEADLHARETTAGLTPEQADAAAKAEYDRQVCGHVAEFDDGPRTCDRRWNHKGSHAYG